MAVRNVSGWMGEAPYCMTRSVRSGSASCRSSISTMVGTASAWVTPSGSSSRHAATVKRGTATVVAPAARATMMLPRPAMWWNGEAVAKTLPVLSCCSAALSRHRRASRSCR